MEDKTNVFRDLIEPLQKRIYYIAQEHGIPCTMVFQTSDGEFYQTHSIPAHAANEMKQSAQWWMQSQGE